MKDLKEKVIRGGMVKVVVQITNFTLRIVALMVLARLLDPKDFGLVGMVTAVTGVLNLFRDFGLSSAAVQRGSISEEESSTLFWINVAVGAVLSLLLMAITPAVVGFYHETRLFWITIVLSVVFFINSVGIQQSALLQRQMRFVTLAGLDLLSLSISILVAIGMALRGYGYWSLVGMSITSPTILTIGLWLTSKWRPGWPRRQGDIGSMVRFGGTVTLNSVVVYLAYNLEKVLLGRFWGAEAIGLYGRSYQLITIPTENINTAAGEVAFPALSRVHREDPSRFKSYFLKGYALVISLTIPITIVCALFANDLIVVLLGPRWADAATIFRLLSPTILIFAMINPLAWLLFSLGLVGRSLKVALVLAPLVILGYVLGLPYGPKGVAFGYSSMMILWLVPHAAWCVHKTPISFRDIVSTVLRPLISGTVAAAAAFALQFSYFSMLSPLLRLLFGSGVLICIYSIMLFFVMGQGQFYFEVVRSLRKATSAEEIVLSRS